MKMQLKLMLLLFGATIISLMGCKKDDGRSADITGYYTNSTPTKTGVYNTGYFTTSGGLKASGNATMDVHIVGDSSHCTASFIASEGSFTMAMNCSNVNMTGHWNITSGTGRYAELKGEGSLTMSFPPNTPTGVVGIEAMTGIVWLHQ